MYHLMAMIMAPSSRYLYAYADVLNPAQVRWYVAVFTSFARWIDRSLKSRAATNMSLG